jgi:hypothetical protein
LRSTNKYLRLKRPRKSSDPAAAAAHLLTRDEAWRIAASVESDGRLFHRPRRQRAGAACVPERVAGKSKFLAVNNKT